jgi:hypothetical protein
MANGAESGLTVLDADMCLGLLRSQEVGRITLRVARHRETFPVTYAVNDDSVVFCTADGTKLAAADTTGDVEFEVHGYDTDSNEEWSVLLKGHAEEVAVYDVLDDDAYSQFPWSAGPKPRFARLLPEEIAGRRFHVSRKQPQDSAFASH